MTTATRKKNNNIYIREATYLTRNHLLEIADKGEEWDFNRQLSLAAIRKLTEDESSFYPVSRQFLHGHRHGEKCEPHQRLVLETLDGIAIADVPLDYAASLPRALYIQQCKRIVAVLLLDEDGEPVTVRYNEMNRTTRRALRYAADTADNDGIRAFLDDVLITAST